MSNASMNSSNRRDREKIHQTEIVQELESVRALNNSLRAYLEHLRLFKSNIQSTNENFHRLNKVNSSWIELYGLVRK